jgi:hypothetical protein
VDIDIVLRVCGVAVLAGLYLVTGFATGSPQKGFGASCRPSLIVSAGTELN